MITLNRCGMVRNLLCEGDMLESFVEIECEGKVPVRLRGGPGDGQLFHLVGPPPVISFGAAEACYMRVPTDGFALEYRFAPGR